MKTNKLITKVQINHKSTQSYQHTKNNKMERQKEEIEKYKDDSSRMFKAIKNLNKMKK